MKITTKFSAVKKKDQCSLESLSYQKNLDSSIVSAPSVQNQFSSCRFQVFEHFRVNSPKSTEGLSDQQEATLTRKYWHFVSCA